MANVIERQRHIIDFTLSSLLRRKGKNGALLAVYTLIIFILASVLFFSHALRSEAGLVLRDTPEIIVQRIMTGRYQPVPLSYAGKIGDIRGVISVRPRLWGYYYDANFLANYTLVVPGENPPEPGTIDIGSGISKLREAYPGDTIGFTGFDGKPRDYVIRKVISDESQLVSADLILISEADYRSFSGIPADQATDLVLKVRNPKEYTTIAEKIRRLLPDTRPIVRNEILRTYDAVFSWRSGLVIVIFSAAALAFVIFAWDKATGLSAEERKEIGILKASRLGNVGYPPDEVLGRAGRLPDRLSAGGDPRLLPCLLRLVVHLCAGPQGVVHALSPVQAGADHQFRPRGRHILPDRRALHRHHDHPVLAGCDHRPGCGHALRGKHDYGT